MNTTEQVKEKTDQNLEEENSSGTDKSPDDLEVDNILSHQKADQQNPKLSTENLYNPIVSLLYSNRLVSTARWMQRYRFFSRLFVIQIGAMWMPRDITDCNGNFYLYSQMVLTRSAISTVAKSFTVKYNGFIDFFTTIQKE